MGLQVNLNYTENVHLSVQFPLHISFKNRNWLSEAQVLEGCSIHRDEYLA